MNISSNISSRVVFSSIFFFMAIFVFLSLIVSSLSDTFAQLFLVFSAPYRAYDFVNNILLLGWVIMCVVFVLKSLQDNINNLFDRYLAGGIGLIVFIVFITRILGNHATETINITYGLSNKLSGIFLDNLLLICVFILLYIFFILCPLLLGALKWRLNIFNKWGERLEFYKPSLNVSLFMLFACGIQPFYDKNNLWLYLDLWTFYVGLLLLVIMLYRDNKAFGFYEYANVLWLIIGVLIFIFSSKVISQTNYNTTRMIFIIIALMGWCGDWMSASMQRESKPKQNPKWQNLKKQNPKMQDMDIQNLNNQEQNLKKLDSGNKNIFHILKRKK